MDGKQLKNSILQWAIQGKLVPQDPNDEPAIELLHRINPQIRPITEDTPFDIPKSWCWVMMGDIGDWGAGATPSKSEPSYYNGDILWLRTGELNNGIVYDTEIKITEKALKECSLRLNKVGDVLIAMYGATIGKVAIVGKEMTTNQACCACTPFEVYNYYLFYFLMASQSDFVKKGEGGAQPNISREKLIHHLIPIPPLAEQQRIVARIEELMPLVERYAQAQASLDKLNGDIKDKLKKSILQEAIQGKLIPQDPNDEPAIELLHRINPQIRPITEDTPFDIPDNWCWCKLDDIGNIVTGSTPSKNNKEYYNGNIPFFKPPDLEQGTNVCKASDYLSELGYEQSRKLPSKSILVTCIGTIGKTGLLSVEGTCNQQINAIIPYGNILPLYVYYVCISDYMQTTIRTNASATTLSILNKGKFAKLLIPIPPLAEQKRIVARIEELFAIVENINS